MNFSKKNFCGKTFPSNLTLFSSIKHAKIGKPKFRGSFGTAKVLSLKVVVRLSELA